MPQTAARSREVAIARMKLVVPTLFAVGFLFYAAITVYPLAGMPGPPLEPFGGTRPFVVWLVVASACGGLFALFGALLLAVSASADEEAGEISGASGKVGSSDTGRMSGLGPSPDCGSFDSWDVQFRDRC